MLRLLYFLFLTEGEMPNARENNKGGLTEYEQKRKAIIADNKRRLEALKIPSLSSEGRQAPTRKRTKVSDFLVTIVFGTLDLYSIIFFSHWYSIDLYNNAFFLVENS